MGHYDDLRERIRGPVYPILPAFNDDESLDFDATAQYVEYLNSFNVQALMVTAGTSRFNLLSNDEISQLNRTVVEANKGQAVVIVANPMIGPTSQAIAFAQEAEEMGADAMLLYNPERYYGDDPLYDYFSAIARSTKTGVMIHANPMRHAAGGAAQYSVDVCRRLAELDNFIGMKEEHGDADHRYKLATHLGDKLVFIVAGKAMRMFTGCFLFGVQAYLVSVGSFKPQIEEDFYAALMAGDYARALEPIRKYEEAFFDVAMPMGWHIAMKGALALLGLMPDFERTPLQPATVAEREKLRAVLSSFGWL